VITQHMPAVFTASFAARLNRVCAAQVEEARDGARLAPGRIYLAPGGDTHLEVGSKATPMCRLTQGDPVNGHRPSVDVLFESIARLGRPVMGVILTGMGKDGAKGLLTLREAGARTLGQDEASCVVYGMPRVAFEIGAVEKQVSLPRMASAILNLCAAEPQRSA
jgi:two-component system chemotaxis response regulator CheB